MSALLALLALAGVGLSSAPQPALAAECNTTLLIGSVQPASVNNSAAVNLVVTRDSASADNFEDGASVVLDGYGAVTTTFVSTEVLNAQLPPGIPPGRYTVRVINPLATCAFLEEALRVIGPTDTPEPTDTPKPSTTPEPSGTPGPTAYVRPVIVVQSYGASSTLIVPGQDLDFEITLRNAGQSTATNIVATFVAGDFIPRATGGVNAVGTLAPGESSRFFQPLTASSSLEGADQGSLEVKVTYTDLNAQSYEETFTLSFAVQEVFDITNTPSPTPTSTPSLRPQLLIEAYTIDVTTLQPGTRFNLALEIVNVGSRDAERVSMVFGGGSQTLGAGTAAPGGVSGAEGQFNIFAPLESSNVQFLGDIAAGVQLDAGQRMIVNAAANPGAYAVKFSLLYSDDQGGSYTDDQVITLLVESRPLVDVSFYREAGVLLAGQPNQLPLQVVNLGRSTVVLGGLTVSAPNAEFSNNITLVGTLDAGGYFTLDATVIPEAGGPLELTVTIDYTDDFNQRQLITQTLMVDVQEAPTPEFGAGGAEGGFPGGPNEAGGAGPEAFGQKVLRFVLGLVGLDSGRPQAAEALPPPTFEQETVPSQ